MQLVQLIGPGISLLNNISFLVVARDDLTDRCTLSSSACAIAWCCLIRAYYIKKHAPDQNKMLHFAEVSTLVTLFAAFNTTGRLFFGLISDKLKHRVSTVDRHAAPLA